MDIKQKIEALLFVSAKPLSLKQLVELSETEKETVEKAAAELIEDYKNNERGMAIIENSGKLQMVTRPELAEIVAKLIKAETSGELTRPSLEALTIIAYRGPITKFELDKIRGVNCAMILRNLLLRGLIEAKEAKEAKDDQETKYLVTFDFIRFLGINAIEELPDYEKLTVEAAENFDQTKINNETKNDLAV
ncbi:MAG: SMC-Scp complex subunit ScpB [Patescibacteria group bacterium]|nr:SMC-Scp complex subunit ScpB [Patescibacteria group bacterium]